MLVSNCTITNSSIGVDGFPGHVTIDSCTVDLRGGTLTQGVTIHTGTGGESDTDRYITDTTVLGDDETSVGIKLAKAGTISGCVIDSLSDGTGIDVLTNNSPQLVDGGTKVRASKIGIKARVNNNLFVRDSELSNNETGVRVVGNNNDPDLGTVADPGGSNILGSVLYHVHKDTLGAGTTYAQRNYWGVVPPPDSLFLGSVVYTPFDSTSNTLASFSVPFQRVPARPFTLSANYPNPFSDVTRIRLNLVGNGAHVDMQVFDLQGRQVAQLWSGYLLPGSHEVTWTGRNSAGARVASGMYFIRARVDNEIETRRAFVVR